MWPWVSQAAARGRFDTLRQAHMLQWLKRVRRFLLFLARVLRRSRPPRRMSRSLAAASPRIRRRPMKKSAWGTFQSQARSKSAGLSGIPDRPEFQAGAERARAAFSPLPRQSPPPLPPPGGCRVFLGGGLPANPPPAHEDVRVGNLPDPGAQQECRIIRDSGSYGVSSGGGAGAWGGFAENLRRSERDAGGGHAREGGAG